MSPAFSYANMLIYLTLLNVVRVLFCNFQQNHHLFQLIFSFIPLFLFSRITKLNIFYSDGVKIVVDFILSIRLLGYYHKR